MIGTSEKRSQDAEEFDQKIKVLIVDIEGTTTSISFVKDTLFPYIRENLQVYLKNHWKEPEFIDDLTLLRKQAESDKENGVEGLVPIPAGNDDDDEICQAVLNNILWQMDLDRKTQALKQLQGHVMREGYLNGKLKGHVYDDVQPALKSWTHNGRQVYVYSSGSVAAQKLLFEFSEKGNLLEFFSGHFDTDVGPKVESSSYSNIAKQLNCKSEEIMFLTDVPKEAVAARGAGLHAVLVVRPGNAPLSDDDCHKFRVIKSFDDIVFEASAKRTKLSVNEEPSSNNSVPNEPGEHSNSDMQMDVDVDVNESCSKVSEGAPLPSKSQEKTQNKSEEAAVLQNGSAQEQKVEQTPDASNEDSKMNTVTEPQKGIEDISTSASAPEKSVLETKTDSSASASNISSMGAETTTVKKVDSTSKTENTGEDSIGKQDDAKSKSNEELQSVSEITRDKKTAEAIETQESMETIDKKMESDKQCSEEKTDLSKERTAVTSGETKTVENVKPAEAVKDDKTKLAGDVKTGESNGELKTVDPICETKTVEVNEAKTVQTASEEKTAGSVEETKTVESSSESKTVESSRVETTSKTSEELKSSAEETTTEPKNLKAKVPETVEETKIPEITEEMKTPEVIEEVKTPEVAEEVKAPELAEEAKAPELAEEAKAPELAEEAKAPELAEEAKAPELAEEAKAPELAEEVKVSIGEEIKVPEVAEEVKAPVASKEAKTIEVAEEIKPAEIAEEVKVPESAKEVKPAKIAEEVKASESAEEVKTLEIAEEEKAPEVEEAKIPEVAKEEKVPEIAEEMKSGTVEGADALKSAEKTQATKTADESRASKIADAESMECEEVSKTEESIKASEVVENASTSESAGDKEKASLVDATKIEKNNISHDLKNDLEETKQVDKNKSVETTEEKMVTENCGEENVSVEKKDSKVDGNITEITSTENGDTDVDMKIAAPSSSSNQNAENDASEKKVSVDIGDGENKTAVNDSSTRKDEAMETDGHTDKDSPMDVESAETSTDNGENVELKNDCVKEKENENVEVIDSKTNGINNSHAASPAVICEENKTDVKVLDNENIKLKKSSEESETAKLITPPSAQS